MFDGTRIHPGVVGGRPTVRVGSSCPGHGVNLAYFKARALDPGENLVLSDLAGSIPENTAQSKINEFVAYQEETDYLVNADTHRSTLVGGLFLLTDRVKSGIPLYYRYTLKSLHRETSISDVQDAYGGYIGDGVSVVPVDLGNAATAQLMYEIVLEPVSGSFYKVHVYTDTSESFVLKAVYNGYLNGTIVAGIEETIVPGPAMQEKSDYLVENPGGASHVAKIAMTNNVVDDLRSRLEFKFVVTGHMLSGQDYASASVLAKCVHKDYAFPHEAVLFRGEDFMVSNLTPKELVLAQHPELTQLQLDAMVYSVALDLAYAPSVQNKSNVILMTDPDGIGPVYAQALKATGIKSFVDLEEVHSLQYVPSLYRYTNERIVPGFAVKVMDLNTIRVVKPDHAGCFANWYLKIQCGYFERLNVDDDVERLVYKVSEYDGQPFVLNHKPYVFIEMEQAKILDKRTVKLTHTHVVENYKTYTISAYLHDGVSATPLPIESVAPDTGLVTLASNINGNEPVYVDYVYMEYQYIYKGFDDTQDGVTYRANLDLNPGKYHSIKRWRNGQVEQIPSYFMFNQTVYIYLKPYKIYMRDGNQIESQTNIYHRFEPVSGGYDILLATVRLRHNSTHGSVSFVDTRSRGGGLNTGIPEEVRKTVEPESEFYYDIGSLDGKAFVENGTLAVSVDRSLLKANGGRLEKSDVDEAFGRWMAAGTMPIVDYVDVYSQKAMSDSIGMTVESVPVDGLSFKPKLFIAVTS